MLVLVILFAFSSSRGGGARGSPWGSDDPKRENQKLHKLPWRRPMDGKEKQQKSGTNNRG